MMYGHRTIHAAAMWPCATRAHVRYAHTTVEHHNYTLCCKHSTLAHHALLQHRDTPPHRRRHRKFTHPARKGARAFGPPRHATQRSRKIAMPCLLQMPPCSGFGTASDSPCPDHGPTNQPTSKPCRPEPNEGSPSIAANEA